MRYALRDPVLGVLEGNLFASFHEARTFLDALPMDDYVIVQRSTTVEDRRYLGDEWLCRHCLPVEDCTSCNPKYKDAELLECVPCDCITWHLEGSCLHCEEMRNEH